MVPGGLSSGNAAMINRIGGETRLKRDSAMMTPSHFSSSFDKAAAQTKKEQLMRQYDCCGHGDILVGDTWEDEIDLVVRPVGEMDVDG